MNAAFSFLISVGIIAFGLWITAGTIAAGSPLAWTLMGVCTENLIRVDDVMESPKLAE